MFKNYLLPTLLLLAIFGTVQMWAMGVSPENPYAPEYVIAQDTIPLEDRQDDFINSPASNPFDLNDPSNIEQNVEYDPTTNSYIITETIGDDYFRSPTYMTFEEYMDYRAQQQNQSYFDELAGRSSGQSGGSGLRDPVDKIDVQQNLLDRLFGGTEVDIRPQGNIDLTFGVDFQNVENPALPPRQQRQGGFDFDMAIQMNVEGQIGEKLKLNTNYNTQATFDFDNQLKLDYDTDAFSEDEIIKKLEAGNVSLPLRSQLIQGAQSLFGLKTELQFGHLRLTALASQQKSELETITVQGGAQEQQFEVRADEYDENRHFFLSHYNRATFEEALENLPQIRSLFRVEKIQVFITNDRQETENVREIVAITDLGEGNTARITNINPNMQPPNFPVNPDIAGQQALPDNTSNPIYGTLVANDQNKLIDRVTSVLSTPPFNFSQGRDFEKVTARMLSPSEFTFHPELGFVSLNINVQPDQVVGVAYQYSYNGEVFQVGQFADDVQTTQDGAAEQQVLFLRMLKATTQRVDLPNWDLMMKNVYPIGAFNVSPQEFRLDIFYEDPEGAPKSFLPDTRLEGKRLLNVFNLDNLNTQGDPQPDGVFDFVAGVTINPRNGRIMFPKLEPFGDALAEQIDDQSDELQYVYNELYDDTKVNAREIAYKNRFLIKGTYKSSVSSEISLGAFNIPPGSVNVSASGQILREGIDYEVDYGIGKVRILNDALLASGAPIRISFEDNTLFGFQTKTMVGLRADYEVGDNLQIGATYLHLFERPFTQKVNIGDDPINNRIYGADLNYSQEVPLVTKLVDKLPGISTNAPSNLTFATEAAVLQPGHSNAINDGSNDDKKGIVFLDDFEGSVSGQDMRAAPNQWKLASVPQYHPDFPEGELNNSLEYGMNRAKLSWYRINQPLTTSDPYQTSVELTEIFPNFTNPNSFGGNTNRAFTFNLNYFPSERGPYNFDIPDGTTYSAGAIPGNDGKVGLAQPETRWAGIMRALNNNDFQAANYEFIEFWVLSPYLNPDGSGTPAPDADDNDGEILIHLGNVSEDILRDSRKFFENGLPTSVDLSPRPTVDTRWGRVPVQQQITAAFDARVEVRDAQDVGLDGLSDSLERITYDTYLNAVAGIAPAAASDPSSDNFKSYLDEDFQSNGANSEASIYERYFNQNNPEGNSRSPAGNFSAAGDQNPDAEDLNRDFTLNETESYFEYRIPIEHDGNGGIKMEGNPYVTESVLHNADQDNGGDRIWYRFKVPLDQIATEAGNEYFKRYNGIQDFRSIRFWRMIVKDFEQPTSLRFARMELVRNQWRRFRQAGGETGLNGGSDEALGVSFDVNAVNVEENSSRQPFGYILPPGVIRERAVGGINLAALQNEQALSLNVCGLPDGKDRSIYKLTTFDMRLYESLKMFVHAERKVAIEPEIDNGDLRLFVRLGSDLDRNYYEYEMPLYFSDEQDVLDPTNPDYPPSVWLDSNDVHIDFEALKALKQKRNDQNVAFNEIFPTLGEPARITDENGNLVAYNEGTVLRIKGNPNLGLVKGVMVGIRNPSKGKLDFDDPFYAEEDGQDHCAEIWINEMRVSGLSEQGGYAALARADLGLADWGNISAAAGYSSIGFGALDQQLAERSREEITNFEWALNLELGKFFPEKWGIRLPFYYQDSREIKTPQFDPYDLDIELKDKVANLDPVAADSTSNIAKDVTRIRSYNFTNVRKERTNTEKKPMPWNIENFSGSYSNTKMEHRDPIVENELVETQRGAIDYSYSRRANFIKPFKKLSDNDWLKLITDFNFNPLPNSVGLSTVMDREFSETKYRFAGTDPLFNTFYNKRWTWDRNYNLTWDFAKALKFNFNATNSAVVDEAPLDIIRAGGTNEFYRGRIDTDDEKALIQENIRGLARDKNYTHNFGLDYTLPTKLIPAFDWMNIRGSYNATYGWSASALNIDSLGHVIQNTQSRQANVDLDFTKLYKKSDFLKSIDGKSRNSKTGRSPRSRNGDKGKDKAKEKDDDDKKKKEKEKKKKEPSKATKALVRPFLLLRKAKFTYSENLGTVLPGYNENNPDFFGMSDNFSRPGWDFVAGLQPNLNQEDYYTDRDWLYQNRDWISYSIWQQAQVQQNYSQTLDAKVTLEPIKDFKIDLDAKRNFTSFHTENFKRDTIIFGGNDYEFANLNPGADEYHHLVPKDAGSYTISYFAMGTLFQDKTEDLVALFGQFEDNRDIIADRLGVDRGDTSPHRDSLNRVLGYPNGYGRTQQDVLIPAFLAAYRGDDPNVVGLDIFKTIPKVNWRVQYNGLSKLPAFKKIFSSVNLQHGYKSSLSVNNFQTDLFYDFQNTAKTNQENGNYFSRFEIPALVINEQFIPLLGIDVRMKNGMDLRLDFKKSRNLQMSFLDNSLNETKTTEYVIGYGYKMKDVDIPFLTGSKKKKGKQPKVEEKPKEDNGRGSGRGARGGSGGNARDLDISFDLSFRDDVTFRHILDQGIAEPTRGTTTIRISPAVEYRLNSQLSLRLFFDYNRNVPKTSQGYPITNTAGGLTVRFSLQ